jgi:hypothetical protein
VLAADRPAFATINRLTWRRRDDATGAGGDNIESLLAFLREDVDEPYPLPKGADSA